MEGLIGAPMGAAQDLLARELERRLERRATDIVVPLRLPSELRICPSVA